MSSPPERFFSMTDPSKILCIGATGVAAWFLENAHPLSRVECVVPPTRMTVDLATSPATGPYERHAHRFIAHRGYPHMVLRSFDFSVDRFRTFDIVYVEDPDIRTMILAYDFLKIGGVMVAAGEMRFLEAFLATHDVDVVRSERGYVRMVRTDAEFSASNVVGGVLS